MGIKEEIWFEDGMWWVKRTLWKPIKQQTNKQWRAAEAIFQSTYNRKPEGSDMQEVNKIYTVLEDYYGEKGNTDKG